MSKNWLGLRPTLWFASLVSLGASNLKSVVFCFLPEMVGLTGLEPVTLRLSSACSNQLSYRPLVVRAFISLSGWWRHGDSNPRPIACKATALPTELCPQGSEILVRPLLHRFFRDKQKLNCALPFQFI